MLRLKANPTFKAPVEIPLPGGKIMTITVEFKHKTKDEYETFIEGEKSNKRSDEEALMDLAVSWEGVDGEFNKENLHQLCQQYHGAAGRIAKVYILELTQSKEGN